VVGIDASVRGANELEAIGRRFKAAGAKGLRKELLAGIRKTNKPTISAIRANALATLPRRGGLAAEVAGSRIGTRSRLSGNRVGVEIRGVGRIGLTTLNRGRLRHPVYGNRGTWVQQQVPAGWFTDPIEKDMPRIREGIEDAMKTVARKIERG
jgi:hypothetical protein